MVMKFLNETGCILSPNLDILHWKKGEIYKVDFSGELLWEIHKSNPGMFFAIAHTHPANASNMSGRDELTLRTWAKALYPYPARMIIVSEMLGVIDDFSRVRFSYKTWLATLEPKEDWIARGKEGSRKVNISLLLNKRIFFEKGSGYFTDFLIQNSYE